MTQKLPPPITKETFEKMVGKWARIVKFGESASIYFVDKAGLMRRLNQLFSRLETSRQENLPAARLCRPPAGRQGEAGQGRDGRHRLLETPRRFEGRTLLNKYFSKVQIQVIDLETQFIEDLEDLKDLELGQIGKSKKAIFILGCDRILAEKLQDLLNSLARFATFNRRISLLLFFHQDFTHSQFHHLFKKTNILLENVIFHPLYSKKDIYQLIKHYQVKWSLKIGKKLKQKILEQCNGYFWFGKQALRFIRDYPDQQDKIFSHEQMGLRLKLTWEKFLKSEKKVLEKIVIQRNDFENEELHSLNFLKKIGWLKKEKNKWKITVPLLAKFIKKNLVEKVDLIVDLQDRIFFKGVLIDQSFSLKEKKVLGLLLANRGEVVNRDKIAKIIWGKNWQDLYSDWAIDQTISRLRKKLLSLEIDPHFIKTIRKKGFSCPKNLA